MPALMTGYLLVKAILVWAVLGSPSIKKKSRFYGHWNKVKPLLNRCPTNLTFRGAIDIIYYTVCLSVCQICILLRKASFRMKLLLPHFHLSKLQGPKWKVAKRFPSCWFPYSIFLHLPPTKFTLHSCIEEKRGSK